jgi:hypothetical protein
MRGSALAGAAILMAIYPGMLLPGGPSEEGQAASNNTPPARHFGAKPLSRAMWNGLLWRQSHMTLRVTIGK